MYTFYVLLWVTYISMSTTAIAAIFGTLLILGGFLLFGGSASAPNTHVMPDGSTMEDTDPRMNEDMSGTHVMEDGTVMKNSDVRMDTTGTGVTGEKSNEPTQVDHSMMGHSM
jgi:hypothetical protein